MKKCIYCSSGIPEESVIDFCETCGTKVWGEKMFRTILHNMNDARERGDLALNRVDEEGDFSNKF